MAECGYRAIALMAGFFMLGAPLAAPAAELPDGFVYLSDIDPTIGEDIRYAGKDNFTHAVVPGYHAAECVLAEAAAQALAAVQSELSARGYGLVVHDCYRPAKAVRHFVEWASEPGKPDPVHYPHLTRERLLAEGYIARTSKHSSGATVDLTLVRLSGSGAEALPMGTAFDVFDPLSHTASSRIPAAAKANRRLLVNAMKVHGFRNYRREWWHFSYRPEPFPGRAFDFDILPKSP